jgi:hypothetical protein
MISSDKKKLKLKLNAFNCRHFIFLRALVLWYRETPFFCGGFLGFPLFRFSGGLRYLWEIFEGIGVGRVAGLPLIS